MSKARRTSVFTKIDVENVKVLSENNYKSQAIKFLNVFWNIEPLKFKDNATEREEVWAAKNLFVKLDKKGEEGNELDEFNAHRALERTEGALTVQEMRKAFAEADVDHNHQLSLMEFFLFKYHLDWNIITNTSACEGDTKVQEASEKVRLAQDGVQSAIAAAEFAQRELQSANEAQEKARADEVAAIAKEESAIAAEEEVVLAKEAQAAVLQSIAEQESAVAQQIADLEAKGSDESLGPVTRNKAKAELAQIKQQDPLPLRKAKIGLEAALRRVTKALKEASKEKEAAVNARLLANQSVADAEAARAASEQAAAASEDAVGVAEGEVGEAEKYLVFCKTHSVGTDEGTFWWMDRELEEAKKYMPKSKIAKLASPSKP